MKKCKNCNQEFLPNRKGHYYCGLSCQQQAWFRRNAKYWSNYVNEYNKNHRQEKTEYQNKWSKAKRDALKDSGYSKLKKKDEKEFTS